MFVTGLVLLLINCTFVLGNVISGNGNGKNTVSLFKRMRGIKAGSMGFLLSRYQIQEEISHPKWPVYRAIDTKTSQPVAVKLGDSNSHLADEIKILKELNGVDRDSKYIIRVEDSKITPQGSELVFEYLPASLGTFMYKQQSGKAFSNAQLQVIAKQIVTSLAFMHDHGFVHGSIKPENIMVENIETLPPKVKYVGSHVLQRTVLKKSPKIKLNDFSAALDITKRVQKYKGSRSSAYASPEAILFKNYSTPADMWALGATLFELRTGRCLFALPEEDNRVELLAALQVSVGTIPRSFLKGEAHLDNQALSRETEKQSGSKYSDILRLGFVPEWTEEKETDFYPQFKDLLKNLLVYEPEHRLTAKDSLNHPFFKIKF